MTCFTIDLGQVICLRLIGETAFLAEAGYRVIAPDMRGMGRTEAPPNPESYDIDAITGDLLGLLNHLNIKRAVFVGLDKAVREMRRLVK